MRLFVRVRAIPAPLLSTDHDKPLAEFFGPEAQKSHSPQRRLFSRTGDLPMAWRAVGNSFFLLEAGFI